MHAYVILVLVLQMEQHLTLSTYTTELLYGVMNESCVSVVLVNSLTTVDYLMEVLIKLWIPSLVCIFTSAWS